MRTGFEIHPNRIWYGQVEENVFKGVVAIYIYFFSLCMCVLLYVLCVILIFCALCVSN